MTLMELLVALTIFALLSGAVLTHLGPWMAQGRMRMDEARFWREVAPAQLLLSEIAAGAIDDDERRISSSRIRVLTYAPRLAPAPIDVTLWIEADGHGSRLLLHAPTLAEAPSVLLVHTAPLRFAETPDRIQLEMRRDRTWAPIVTTALLADAPFVCAFDAISRTCR